MTEMLYHSHYGLLSQQIYLFVSRNGDTAPQTEGLF